MQSSPKICWLEVHDTSLPWAECDVAGRGYGGQRPQMVLKFVRTSDVVETDQFMVDTGNDIVIAEMITVKHQRRHPGLDIKR